RSYSREMITTFEERSRNVSMLSATDAVAQYKLLERQSIRCWVMGGWGVDALLHRQTRPHKDLDVLVLLDDLPTLWTCLAAHGFPMRYVWEENRWIDGESGRWPTAFVAADTQGRELDAHVIELGPNGTIIQHYDNPWPFPNAIAGQGSIAGVAITCISKEAQ